MTVSDITLSAKNAVANPLGTGILLGLSVAMAQLLVRQFANTRLPNYICRYLAPTIGTALIVASKAANERLKCLSRVWGLIVALESSVGLIVRTADPGKGARKTRRGIVFAMTFIPNFLVPLLWSDRFCQGVEKVMQVPESIIVKLLSKLGMNPQL